MRSTDEVIRALRERGELWESTPGIVGLRGSAGALCADLERTIAALALGDTAEEWRVPPALSLDALERADYFASFPQWLTVAAHLEPDPKKIERLATAASPVAAVRSSVAPADAALMPAVCYHVYAALADHVLTSARRISVQGSCWRHEGERLVPLERGWAFTMREVVCLGSAADVEDFLECGIRRVSDLAEALGLQSTIAEACDPFFAPTARGKALLQRVKNLKRELLLPLDSRRVIAAASFNCHETFFGDAFAIRDADGAPVSTGCIAFGIERWLLAWLSTYGPDPVDWPAIEVNASSTGRL